MPTLGLAKTWRQKSSIALRIILVDDGEDIIPRQKGEIKISPSVVFDFETTGLNSSGPMMRLSKLVLSS